MDSVAFYLNLSESGSSTASVRRLVRDRAPNIFELTDVEFVKQFRLNKSAYNCLLRIICNKIPPVVKSTAISPEQKLSLCLRILAEGSYQNAVGKDYMLGMAQPTVSRVLSQVLDIMEGELCEKWINIRMNTDEEMEARSYFYSKSKIPGIVMCIDGTHIRIAKPSGTNSHLFYNRKGFYSLNVLLICDHKQRIRYINAKYPGSSHDSFVWSNSDVSQYFQAQYEGGNRNLRLLGDAGYGLAPWLITPFRTPAPNTPQSRFNKWHSSGRNIIERTIGVWKNWCRCLLSARQLHYSPEKAVQIICVAAALHNLRIHYNIHDEYPDTANSEDDPEADLQEIERQERYYTEAVQLRNQMLQNFL